jgi:CRP/FNR family nitrogen fixation transcriptional regulator
MPTTMMSSAVRVRGLMPAVPPALDALAAMLRYQAGQFIYRSADPTEFWYCILSGAARKYAVNPNGSRRIVDFLLPQDLFGIGRDGRHRFGVDVIADGTTIVRYPGRLVERLADSDPCVARQIREAAFESIRRLETRMLMLGLGRARERVGAFLLELAERLGQRRCPGEICLPMSRCDVADYLALAVETVSRVFTQLRFQGVIRLNGLRNIQVCDWDGLEGICSWDTTASVHNCGRAPGMALPFARF